MSLIVITPLKYKQLINFYNQIVHSQENQQKSVSNSECLHLSEPLKSVCRVPKLIATLLEERAQGRRCINRQKTSASTSQHDVAAAILCFLSMPVFVCIIRSGVVAGTCFCL